MGYMGSAGLQSERNQKPAEPVDEKPTGQAYDVGPDGSVTPAVDWFAHNRSFS